MSFGLHRLGAWVFNFCGLSCPDGIVSVKVTPREASFTEETGSNGLVERAATENVLYDVELVIKAAANYNQVLVKLWQADNTIDGGAGVGTLVVADPNGASTCTSEKAYINTPADLVAAKERGDVTWKLTASMPPSAYNPGGNQI